MSWKLGLTMAAWLVASSAFGAEKNLYEWSALAPIVVTVETVEHDGRYVDVKVDRVLRGDLETGTTIRIDIKSANKQRNRDLQRKLEIPAGERYAVLLEESPAKKGPVYRLVRGVNGARDLPAEGESAVVDALARFVAAQNEKSDPLIWARLEAMLEDTNPIVIATALEQFEKFRQGDPELLLTLRPLLDHPRADVRAGCARLIGQIVRRHPDESLAEDRALRAELTGRARTDDSIAVREAAVGALGAFYSEAATTVLEEVARDDPDQEVRYQAARVLLERRERKTGDSGTPRNASSN